MLKKLFLFACFAAAGFAGIAHGAPKKSGASAPAKKTTPATVPAFTCVGSICVDAETGKVFSGENPDALAQPASVTKLMTILLVLERVDAGQMKFTDPVKASPAAIKEGRRPGGSAVWLAQGETFSVDEMLYALMLRSANDVAVALADHVAGNVPAFVQMMNARAAQLGMTNTHYTTPNGFAARGTQADTSTARDIAVLSRELLKHKEILRYTNTKTRIFRPDSLPGKGQTQLDNHNKLIRNDEACDGLKTGYTAAGGCSIAATGSRGGKRVIAVVLGGKGGANARQAQRLREKMAQDMMNAAFAQLGVANAPVTKYAAPAVIAPVKPAPGDSAIPTVQPRVVPEKLFNPY